MNLEQVLEQKFGFATFRTGQKEIIEDVINGKNVLAMLPTGAGKSLCYQLPAYLLEGSVLVISPLLSLMQDQVQQLKARGEKRVVALNSFLPYEQRKQALHTLDSFRLIYASPEILQSSEVKQALQRLHIQLVVIDEAHCISQWGHEFRTDYLKLTETIEMCGNPPVLALTATASIDVQNDILLQLGIQGATRRIYSVDRPNIALNVQQVESTEEKLEQMIAITKKFKGPGIVYAATRLSAEQLASVLKQNGVQASFYHGGMTNEERILVQQQFVHDQLDVICATNAFGMGIDKADIRFIIHFQYPPELESYLQEIGRAGRDGSQSVSVLFFSNFDHELPEQLIQQEFPTINEIGALLSYMEQPHCYSWHDIQLFADQLGLKEVNQRFLKFQFEKLGVLVEERLVENWLKDEILTEIRKKIEKRSMIKQEKLDGMRKFLYTESCRREQILNYFEERAGEKPTYCCDRCGFRLNELQIIDKHETNWAFNGWEDELALIFHQRGGQQL
ncbi:ATP-dependent DNA helicase RecQ [Bacillus tianshenii]|nr:ATP-dependent DNA helicase RecQ [Bacillus tianshenii]